MVQDEFDLLKRITKAVENLGYGDEDIDLDHRRGAIFDLVLEVRELVKQVTRIADGFEDKETEHADED